MQCSGGWQLGAIPSRARPVHAPMEVCTHTCYPAARCSTHQFGETQVGRLRKRVPHVHAPCRICLDGALECTWPCGVNNEL